MNKLEKYVEIRNELDYSEISFGYSSIYLFNEDEIENGQIGYLIDDCGNLLSGNQNGDWKDNWLVIGYESLNGDPIFIDVNTECFIVYTAINGEGEWNENEISISVENFFGILNVISKISIGRSNPIEIEENPLSEIDRNLVLSEITLINDSRVDNTFWESWLEY